MNENLKNFIEQLTFLSEKYGVVIVGNPRLHTLGSAYKPFSLSYEAPQEISVYGGIDKTGPFLKSYFEEKKIEEENKEFGTAPALMKHKVFNNPKKHMDSDFKSLINHVRDSNYKSSIEGF